MRTNLIIIANCIANVAAGAIVMLAFGQASVGLQIGLAAGAVVLVGGTLFWTLMKFGKAHKVLANGKFDNLNKSTGFLELDQFVRKYAEKNSKLTPQPSKDHQPPLSTQSHPAMLDANEAINELAEIKEFLESIDRRKGGFDRQGKPLKAANRLRLIFKGYGGQFDSDMKQVVSCSREIKRAVEEIVTGSATQADLVNKTTTFIEEMSAQIIAVSDNAESVLEVSANVSENAEKGRQQIEQLVDEMKKIRNHAGSRERKLQALGQHTKEIESIVHSIGTLSSRTDLLALNASIESVRAGEHGRGFAIVAEEVRALAEKSAQAVMDISRRIEMIQLETNQSISVASGEQNQMNQVIGRVSDTLESLHDLCNAANDSKTGLGDIASQTNQQLQLTQDIVLALEKSTDTSQKNRSRAEGANWTSKTLGNVSDQLNESLEMFRVGELVSETGGSASNAASPSQ